MGQFLPAVGEELVDAGVGVRGNTREEVAQVGKGIDAMPFGALDKTVEGGGGGTPAAAAREKPVVASDLRIPVNPITYSEGLRSLVPGIAITHFSEYDHLSWPERSDAGVSIVIGLYPLFPGLFKPFFFRMESPFRVILCAL